MFTPIPGTGTLALGLLRQIKRGCAVDISQNVPGFDIPDDMQDLNIYSLAGGLDLSKFSICEPDPACASDTWKKQFAGRIMFQIY